MDLRLAMTGDYDLSIREIGYLFGTFPFLGLCEIHPFLVL